jgi:hypothetical protein
MPRGAATAPAITPPVVARKFLRVGEKGLEKFDISSSTWSAEPKDYTHRERDSSPEQKDGCKN